MNVIPKKKVSKDIDILPKYAKVTINNTSQGYIQETKSAVA